jgi:hypothetical protein
VQNVGKAILILGIVLVVAGAILWKTGGRLPGDIFIQKGTWRFYFPIVTCILISLALTLLSWLLRK